MVQTAVPINDTNVGGWTELAGDADADAFDELDETIAAADDATTAWRSANNPSVDKIRCGVTVLTDPVSSSGHVLKARCAKNASGGRQIDVVVRLFETDSGILRASTTLTNITDAWTTISYTLSGAEADSISDYGDLRIEVDANDVTGSGPARRLHCTAMELEVPDAAVTRRIFITT